MKQVRLAHLDHQRLELSLEFAEIAPPVPQRVISPFSGQLTDAPGSIRYVIHLFQPRADGREADTLQLNSPTSGNSWTADASKLDHPERTTLISAETTGKLVRFVLDVDGQRKLLGDGRFTPRVWVFTAAIGPMSVMWPNGSIVGPFDSQECGWETPVASETGRSNAEPSVPLPPPQPFPGSTNAMPPPTANSWEFQSPTGNIACHMGQTGAACDIGEYDYLPPPRPQSCQQAWGDRIAFDHGDGPAFFGCHSTSFLGQRPTQAYDTPLSAGAITCVVNEVTGVTCRDTSTDHFFQISRESYQLG